MKKNIDLPKFVFIPCDPNLKYEQLDHSKSSSWAKLNIFDIIDFSFTREDGMKGNIKGLITCIENSKKFRKFTIQVVTVEPEATEHTIILTQKFI